MTLDQIEMIESIVEQGSFQAAAKKLNKSQPSISIGIKKIEKLYDIELFSRAEYRPKLSATGEIFYRYAKKTLASFRDLDTLAKELGLNKESKIRFYIDPLIGFKKIEPILALIQNQQAHLPVYLENEILFDNINALKKQSCEFSIGSLAESNDPEIEAISFCQIDMVPVISKKLLNHSKISLEYLNSTPNIIVKTKNSDDLTNIHSSCRWYVNSHIQKEELIINGLGWGRLPLATITSKQNKSVLIKIDKYLYPQLTLNMYFCRNRNQPLGPTAQKVWAFVKNNKAFKQDKLL